MVSNKNMSQTIADMHARRELRKRALTDQLARMGALRVIVFGSFAEDAGFTVMLPLHSRITLLRDGDAVASAEGTELIYRATEPGAYRVEVCRKGQPWIYSNHIRLHPVK